MTSGMIRAVCIAACSPATGCLVMQTPPADPDRVFGPLEGRSPAVKSPRAQAPETKPAPRPVRDWLLARKAALAERPVLKKLRDLGVHQYAADPSAGMQQLPNQSEDHRQVGEMWQRFWLNDMRSHMTTGRVHGGITLPDPHYPQFPLQREPDVASESARELAPMPRKCGPAVPASIPLARD